MIRSTRGEQIYSEYKYNRARGCDGLLTEELKMAVTDDEESEILMELFNAIRGKRISRRMENFINTTNL
jgi:hypothetical protein